MTRFEKEINGIYGEFWVENAKKEVARLMEESKTEIVIEKDGAIKWLVSGNYVPEDCCEKLEYGGFKFNREATRIARDRQQRIFLDEYREKMENHEYDKEELFEMRSAFGEGETVVDIITGKKIKL